MNIAKLLGFQSLADKNLELSTATCAIFPGPPVYTTAKIQINKAPPRRRKP